MAVLIAAIFSVDVALYGYWGFRLDATLFFYLQSPGDAMASVPLGQFFAQLLMFAVYAFGIYWVLKRFIVPLFPETLVRKRLGGSLIIILSGGILFIPIRGGVTTSTANVGMVYFSQNQFLNHSAINPCFSLIASLSKQQDFAAQFNFFPEEERKEVMDTLSPHDAGTQRDESRRCRFTAKASAIPSQYLTTEYIDYPDGKFLGKRDRSGRRRFHHHA